MGRRGYDSEDDSDNTPIGDHQGGKQKARAKSSRRDDRRVRYDSGDDNRYGRNRRDNGNRSRDRSESRSRSRTRYETRTTAMMKRGESSRAGDKSDDRSKNTDSSRAKRGHSDTEEDEDVIKISRYITADFEDMASKSIDELCALLDVRASKVKQWCDRGLIRIDNTTKHLDAKPLMALIDPEDAKKLKRFLKKVEDQRMVGKTQGGRNQHHDQIYQYHNDSRHGHGQVHHHHDDPRRGHNYIRPHHDDPPYGLDHVSDHHGRQASVSADGRPGAGLMIGTHPSSGLPVIAFCKGCFDRAELCDMHSGLADGAY